MEFKRILFFFSKLLFVIYPRKIKTRKIMYSSFLIFDLETTGLLKTNDSPENYESYPQIVQISWSLLKMGYQNAEIKSFYLCPSCKISPSAQQVHGSQPNEVFDEFLKDASNAEVLISHNIKFDFPVLEAELYRWGYDRPLARKNLWCTMEAGKKYWGYKKYPKLIELAEFCNAISKDSIQINYSNLHNAQTDVDLALQCFVFLMRDNSDLFKNIRIRYAKKQKKVLPQKSIEHPIMRKSCTQCNTLNDEDATYCRICGKFFTSYSANIECFDKFSYTPCLHCKKNTPTKEDENKYCVNCGKILDF